MKTPGPTSTRVVGLVTEAPHGSEAEIDGARRQIELRLFNTAGFAWSKSGSRKPFSVAAG